MLVPGLDREVAVFEFTLPFVDAPLYSHHAIDGVVFELTVEVKSTFTEPPYALK